MPGVTGSDSAVIKSAIIFNRGDTMILSFSGMGDLTNRDNIWFTMKGDKDDADTASLVQIDEDTGLLYINGAAAGVPGNGSITVVDVIPGNLTVRLEAVESAKVACCTRTYYDLQVLYTDDTMLTPARGLAHLIGDITRATS